METGKKRGVQGLFGVGISTVGTIINRTCAIISKHLLPEFIKIPNKNKLEVVDGFKWGLPQVVGAIDGSHIPSSQFTVNLCLMCMCSNLVCN